MGQAFQNGPSKICGKQPLNILHGPFLNTLSHKKFLKMIYEIYWKVILEELNIFRNLN